MVLDGNKFAIIVVALTLDERILEVNVSMIIAMIVILILILNICFLGYSDTFWIY